MNEYLIGVGLIGLQCLILWSYADKDSTKQVISFWKLLLPKSQKENQDGKAKTTRTS